MKRGFTSVSLDIYRLSGGGKAGYPLRKPFLSKGLTMLVEGKIGLVPLFAFYFFPFGAENEEDTFEG